MRKFMREVTVYNYNELSDIAKEKVKEWLLDTRDSFEFSDWCKQDLENLFGINDLEVQYSLAYCQGDGLNIYGEISAKSILDCLENHNGGSQLEKFENALTDEEKKTILFYAEKCDDIKLPDNHHDYYSLSDRIDIVDDWEYQLEEYFDIKDIDKKTLLKFETMVRNIFGTLCRNYEESGYNYFYEISDEEAEDVCESMEYEFYEDGTFHG